LSKKNRKSNHKILLVMLFLLPASAFFFSACSKKNTQQTSGQNSGAKSNENGSGVITPGTGEKIKELCQQFFSIIDETTSMHLFRKGSEKEKLLKRSYKNLIEDISQQTKSEETKKALSKIDSNENIKDCVPYEKVANAVEFVDPDTDPFLQVLRWSLKKYLNELDVNSNYIANIDIEAIFGREGKGAGLIFKQRTDYLLERQAPYLILQGIFPGSVNRDFIESGKLPLGSRIYKIRGHDVSKLTYENALAAINNGLVLKEQKGANPPNKNQIVIAVAPPGGSEEDAEEEVLDVGDFERDFARIDFPDPKRKNIIRITITHFYPRAAENLTRSLAKLYQDFLRESDDIVLDGVILDLRGNGGGLDIQAKDILEAFLPSRSTVSWKRTVQPSKNQPNVKDLKLEATKTKNDIFNIDVSAMVVLLDRLSASASEMVAAALKDYGRAILIGERSFGKGIGQRAYSQNVGGLSGVFLVTDSYFFSPLGHSHQVSGITPDIEINDPVNEYQASKTKRVIRMDDYLHMDGGKHRGRVVINPGPLHPKPSLEIPEDSKMVTSEMISSMQQNPKPDLAACKPVKDSSTIREESDCLLEMGLYYVEKLYALQNGESDPTSAIAWTASISH